MILRDISFSGPKENLLFDDVLLVLAENGKIPESLRFWESECPFIVLGKTSSAQHDVFLEKAQQDGVAVLRRSSAGGTVMQGRGCLNYALVLSKDSDACLREIQSSYRYILDKVRQGLKHLGLSAQFFPPSDLALEKEQKKFSGNAQKRLKKFILHHGTLLYHFDLALIEKYLRIPTKVPLYRAQRTHAEFLVNIPFEKERIKQCLAEIFKAAPGASTVSAQEQECLSQHLQSLNEPIVTV